MKWPAIAMLLFVSCNSGGSKKAPLSTERLDTVRTIPASITTNPLIFEKAFISGTTAKVNVNTVELYGINIGKLHITGGRIVACDPLHIDEYGIPFTTIFPTGSYPVQLAVARLGQEEMIAFSRIMFSDEPVTKWEYALQAGQQQVPITEEKKYGFSVDGGVGIFADEQTIKLLNAEQLTSMNTPLYKSMDVHRHKGWKYGLYPADSTHNVAIVTTGAGDGYYASYVGLDKNGKPCRLLTDFDLVKWR